MAWKAGRLDSMSIAQLRLLHPDNVDGQKSFGMEMPRHQLIADILYDEFSTDYDFDMDDPYQSP